MVFLDKVYNDWEEIGRELEQVLELRAKFNIMAFTGQKAILEFGREEDRNELLEAQEIFLCKCTLTGRRWSLGVGTTESDFLKVRDRWIILKGIPFHSWLSETFKLLCSSF